MATKLAHMREATFAPELAIPASDSVYLAIKRASDVVFAALLLVLLAPLMGIIALAIAIDSRGPVIFRQKRVLGGQDPTNGHPDEQVFEFLKFRSMYQNADQRLHQEYVQALIEGKADCAAGAGTKLYKLDCDPRITPVGRFLRKTSLDELPQLINIFKGEMTFVGPRPAIPYEVQNYRTWHLRRLSVVQGLTGLWQVSGRNELNFDEMVGLDIEYAHKRSLALDLKIMLATIPAVVIGRGVR